MSKFSLTVTGLVGLLFFGMQDATAQRSSQKDTSRYQDEVSYSNDIQPIVKNFCVTCHAGDDPEGEFVLTSYKDVRKYTEKGKLLERINDRK